MPEIKEQYDFAMFSKEGNKLLQSQLNKFLEHEFKLREFEHLGSTLRSYILYVDREGHTEVFDTEVRGCIFEYLEKHLPSNVVEAIWETY